MVELPHVREVPGGIVVQERVEAVGIIEGDRLRAARAPVVLEAQLHQVGHALAVAPADPATILRHAPLEEAREDAIVTLGRRTQTPAWLAAVDHEAEVGAVGELSGRLGQG